MTPAHPGIRRRLLCGRAIACLFASLAAAGCRASREIDRDALSLEDRLAAAVSVDRLLQHVRALVALGPRMGGTESGDRAAAYRAAALREAGLDVQTFEDSERLVHDEPRFSFTLLADPEEPLPSAWPYGFSPSAGPMEADLLDAGAEEPPGFDWSRAPGCAVLVSAHPRIVLGEAASAGVAAIVTDYQAGFQLDPDAAFIQELPPSNSNPVPVFAVSRNDAARLRRACREESARVRLELVSRIHRGSPKTVVATLPGRDRGRSLVVCAHGDSDSGGPGADDNASGEAVVLEVARVLAWARREGLLEELAADVRFVIWGSEIHSTRDFLERTAADASHRLIAVLNYDEAGTGAERDCLYVEPDDLEINARLVDVLAAIGVERAGTSGFWTEFATNRSMGGTDSYVFTGASDSRRVPAVTLFTAAFGAPSVVPPTPGRSQPAWRGGESIVVDHSAFYHSSADTPENTAEREPWNVVWCARMGVLATVRLLQGESSLQSRL